MRMTYDQGYADGQLSAQTRVAKLEDENQRLTWAVEQNEAAFRQAEAELAEANEAVDVWMNLANSTTVSWKQAEAEAERLERFIEFCVNEGMRPTKQARVIFSRAEEGA